MTEMEKKSQTEAYIRLREEMKSVEEQVTQTEGFFHFCFVLHRVSNAS